MIVQLDTENADRDLSSQVTVLTHTPDVSNPMMCQALVMVGDGTKNLDGTGGDFEIEITVGGNSVQPGPQVITLGASDTRAAFVSAPFPVPANAEVVVKLLSPNAGDSDVDVTAYLYDAWPITVASGKVAGVVLVDTCTTNTDMRGTDGANTTTPPTVEAIAAEVGAAQPGDQMDLVNAPNATAVTAIQNGLATSVEVTAIQNNTRVVRVVPTVIERPDSGTQTYRIELLLYDAVGNMEVPDSAPTIALVNQAGTDLSARLDSATMSLVSTGRYRAIYTASVTDDLEQLVWTFSVVEGSATRAYGNTSLIVDTTAVDFTAADRSKLEAIKTVTDLHPDGGAFTALIAAVASILADTGTDGVVVAPGSKTGYALANDGVSAAAIATAAAEKVADILLRRTHAKVEASSFGDAISRKSLYGLSAKFQNGWDAETTPGTLSVKKDDGTEFYTETLTGDAAADPVVKAT